MQLLVQGTGMYELTTDGSEFDTVLYVRSACGGTELICADVPGGTETVVLPLTSGETILVVVDGAGECGMFQLSGRRAP